MHEHALQTVNAHAVIVNLTEGRVHFPICTTLPGRLTQQLDQNDL